VIRMEDVTVRFGDREALDGLTFTVPAGRIVGLLGPNGAGKTTTIRCLSGLLRPARGRVLLDDVDLATDPTAARARVGLVPQSLALYPDLSVWQNLRVFAGALGLGRKGGPAACRRALLTSGLTDRRDERVRCLSGGMQRRLNLACALLHDPPVVLCDEPAVGVDATSRRTIFDELKRLRDRGKSILYTTHHLEEAETLCDTILIVTHGRVVAEGTSEALRRTHAPPSGRLRLEVDPGVQPEAVHTALTAAGIAVRALRSDGPNLEEVYLQLTAP
jgi:ABC-2 type transport system ATP-binding protein